MSSGTRNKLPQEGRLTSLPLLFHHHVVNSLAADTCDQMVAHRRGASQILIPIAATEPLARPLLLDCLVRIKDGAAIIRAFDPPASDAEAIHVMDALWETGNRKRLKEILNLPFIATSSDPSVVEIRNKYAARVGK